jgi:hypothetical protein
MNRLIWLEIYGGVAVATVGIFILYFGNFEGRGDVARVFVFVGLGIGFHGLFARNKAGRKKMIDRAVAEFENDHPAKGK